jgi:hypothetical protein
MLVEALRELGDATRLASPPVRFTSAELTEIAQLFRSKLASLREQPSRRTARRPRRKPPTIALPVDQPADDALLRTGEVAALLGVSPSTVAHLNVPCVRTLGGHRRYRWGDVRGQLQRDERP